MRILLGLLLFVTSAYADFNLAPAIPRYRGIGCAYGLNFNSTSDQPIAVSSLSYTIDRIICTNPSTSMTTAVGGFYNAASKTNNVTSTTQVFTALTGATKYQTVAIGGVASTDVQTATIIYLSLTTPQGLAATADCCVFARAYD